MQNAEAYPRLLAYPLLNLCAVNPIEYSTKINNEKRRNSLINQIFVFKGPFQAGLPIFFCLVSICISEL